MNRTPGMPEITQAELIAHIEDENFLRVYGNPVWIRSNDVTHDCVLMSIEYYERMERQLKEMKERIRALCDANERRIAAGNSLIPALKRMTRGSVRSSIS